jgi:hypothetical protein
MDVDDGPGWPVSTVTKPAETGERRCLYADCERSFVPTNPKQVFCTPDCFFDNKVQRKRGER